MAPATLGRAAVPTAPTPIREGRTRQGKCCVSSLRARSTIVSLSKNPSIALDTRRQKTATLRPSINSAFDFFTTLGNEWTGASYLKINCSSALSDEGFCERLVLARNDRCDGTGVAGSGGHIARPGEFEALEQDRREHPSQRPARRARPEDFANARADRNADQVGRVKAELGPDGKQ